MTVINGISRDQAEIERIELKRAIGVFNKVAIWTHVVGIIMFAMTLYVAIKSGLNFDQKSVNLHGYMMLVGFVACQGEAIIMYRLFRYQVKTYTKLFHAGFHIAAIILTSIGMAAILKHKLDHSIKHMYSFHAWLGAIIYVGYISQFLHGFYTFLFPGGSMAFRKASKPLHVAFGDFLLAIAVAQIIMKADAFGSHCSSTDLLCDGAFGLIHHIGFLLVLVYAGLIGWIILNDDWRRRPTPDELAPLPSA